MKSKRGILKRFDRRNTNPLRDIDPAAVAILYREHSRQMCASIIGCTHSQLITYLSKHKIRKQ